MAKFVLEVVEGSRAGFQLPLDAVVDVGRARESALSLDDDYLSRRHARFRPTEEGAIVEDLSSRNGTFVNDQQIHAPARITPGDQVLVGATLLQLRASAQLKRQPSVARPVPPPLAAPRQAPAYLSGPQRREPDVPTLDPLLDVRVKMKARTAPLALFVLVVLAALVFLATR
jgi:hypothetical protein